MKKIIYLFLVAVLFPIHSLAAASVHSGKIYLQVEENGEAWYVHPETDERHFMGRPGDAFELMRSFGLGITYAELQGYLNSSFPSRLSGKIMLDVEKNGEAYYVNPVDLKGYFLGRPADAFNVMRSVGIGITNSDLATIRQSDLPIDGKVTVACGAALFAQSQEEDATSAQKAAERLELKRVYECIKEHHEVCSPAIGTVNLILYTFEIEILGRNANGIDCDVKFTHVDSFIEQTIGKSMICATSTSRSVFIEAGVYTFCEGDLVSAVDSVGSGTLKDLRLTSWVDSFGYSEVEVNWTLSWEYDSPLGQSSSGMILTLNDDDPGIRFTGDSSFGE